MIGVLKKYAEPLLREIAEDNYYSEAKAVKAISIL